MPRLCRLCAVVRIEAVPVVPRGCPGCAHRHQAVPTRARHRRHLTPGHYSPAPARTFSRRSSKSGLRLSITLLNLARRLRTTWPRIGSLAMNSATSLGSSERPCSMATISANVLASIGGHKFRQNVYSIDGTRTAIASSSVGNHKSRMSVRSGKHTWTLAKTSPVTLSTYRINSGGVGLGANSTRRRYEVCRLSDPART